MALAFIIAGTHSGCGKTTISLGLMACLRKKGYVVQPFKAGPDFIDAGLHRLVTGRPSRNLDIWMGGEDFVKNSFKRHASKADISIIEGVMGIFDGEDSTTRLAELLHVPVILVMDAFGMAETASAIVNGLVERTIKDFRDIEFKGVIFNRVSSENHLRRLTRGLGVTCLGYLPNERTFFIPSRHLGLMTAEESPLTEEAIDRLAGLTAKYVNIGEIVNNNRADESTRAREQQEIIAEQSRRAREQQRRLAIARDKAFSFYYEDNLDMLREWGFEIVEVSLLSDRRLPDKINALYIGGGYPEEYAEVLSNNKDLMEDIKRTSLEGLPIYAECGGLIYISEGIEKDGRFFPMAGLLPLRMKMQKRPVLGYREVIKISQNPEDRLRGHEFHYSVINSFPTDSIRSRFKVHNKDGEFIMDEGFTIRNTTGTYIHLHGAMSPDAFISLFREE